MQIAPGPSTKQALTSGWESAIWALPVLVLLAFAGSLSWFAFDVHEQAVEQEFRALESDARIGEAQVSGLLRNMDQFLNTVAREQRSLTPAQRASYDDVLAERKNQFPEIRGNNPAIHSTGRALTPQPSG
jgi:hypothetical protein